MISAAALAGCSSPEEVAQGAGVTAKANASTSSASASASSSSTNGASSFEDNAEQDGGSREFAYGWPAAVSAIPALAARFTDERTAALAEQKAEWAEALREFAGEDCVACTSRGYSKEWKVVADLPRYLSLSADMYLYTGGAHGNSAFEALVWDREAGAALDPTAMFRSEAALQDALGAGWCAALQAERAERLGGDYAEDSFFPCPPIADLTLLLGSSNKATFNRIGLIAAPYVAGSYAEGPYEVTLPVTPALLAAVKPEYKAAFALGK
ncbi:MAG: DUF4163 domain-containing protein [Erythrobacter sp.]|nr:DUF4163 domain-containing protein [Erythrobacter sp.]